MLSLLESCLIFLRDRIENGLSNNVHFLPPKLRQSILEKILMHNTIDNLNCLAILSSVEFLQGLSSLNTQRGRADDDKYLNHVADSLSTCPMNKISNLNLNLYGLGRYVDGDWKGRELNLGGVVRLISQCPDLSALHIRLNRIKIRDVNANSETAAQQEVGLLNIFQSDTSDGGLLNRVPLLEPCRSIIENLEELSIIGCWFSAPFLAPGFAPFRFKNLFSLHLAFSNVDKNGWHELLCFVESTLIDLHLEEIYGLDDVDDTGLVLPIPLPNLKRLKIDGQGIRCGRVFSENLLRCPKLEYVFLSLAYGLLEMSNFLDDESHLRSLNRSKINLEIKINIEFGSKSILDQFCDHSSRFRLVDLFNEKIKHFRLDAFQWNVQLTAALEHVFDVCTNLTSFQFQSPIGHTGAKQLTENWPDRESANTVLARFFANEYRALQLRELHLFGTIDSDILSLVFRNCLNLESLKIYNNANLNDDHLFVWADRGGGTGTKRFLMENCPSVSDAGLIPILINSNCRLKYFKIFTTSEQLVTEGTWQTLRDHCRNVERVVGMPRHLQ